MNKFKHVLSEQELQNKLLVSQYLVNSFKKRRAKKNQKLYINLVAIYELYPRTIENILDEIPRIGYYKDYFYILNHSKNKNLDSYVYYLIVKQLKSDLDNLDYDLPISTLGKWLPREKSKINLACGFVDKLNHIFFPLVKNKFVARKKYRQMKTLLNKKLGTIECFLCSNTCGSIDYHKVAPYSLKKKKRILSARDECNTALDLYETEILSKLTLSEFIKEILLDKYSVEKMENIWLEKKFYECIPYISDIINNCFCVIDLSNDIFNKNNEFFVLGVALSANYFSNCKHIMVGCHIINPHGNIHERLAQMLKYIGPCKIFNPDNYYSQLLEQNLNSNSFIFVTNKKIPKSDALPCNPDLKLLHLSPDYEEYKIIYYHGDKSITKKKLIHHKKKVGAEKIIQSIIFQSAEFKEKSIRVPILIFFIVIVFFWNLI